MLKHLFRELESYNRARSPSSPAAPPEERPAVTVSHGVHAERLPAGNMTVGQIRAEFRDRLGIDPRSRAFLDGHEVEDDTIVEGGQMLSFVRKAGEKGAPREGPSERSAVQGVAP